MAFLKRKNLRRDKVRKDITAERTAQMVKFANKDIITSLLIWSLFTFLCIPILAFEFSGQFILSRPAGLIPISVVGIFVTTAMAVYVFHYQKRIIKNHARASALVGLFISLLIAAKIGYLISGLTSWATGTAIAASIILIVTYEQRFAFGMSMFYCILACLSMGIKGDINLFLTMCAGAGTCCFSLREIRTRMKLLEVGAGAAAIILVVSTATGFITKNSQTSAIFKNAGFNALAALVVAMIIQSVLPLIERIFKVATSMTLLDYSDANQPLLKRLAMEAPGTFSHSLLIGSIAEAAAEAINRNGLLCRVGAYYHDIGKINKPSYFVENEFGSTSRHSELSPAMSQLVIVGHVKDGIEMAKEYGLPAVLRQFIETHHGTTLVEYFYHEAKKKEGTKQSPISETEFRYTGPKPRTKEAAIVMLTDAVEGTVRSASEITPAKIETIVHNMAMKRLQDGQFDECDLTLRELSMIEKSISKSLAAHHHGRIAYPTPIEKSDIPENQYIPDKQDDNQ